MELGRQPAEYVEMGEILHAVAEIQLERIQEFTSDYYNPAKAKTAPHVLLLDIDLEYAGLQLEVLSNLMCADRKLESVTGTTHERYWAGLVNGRVVYVTEQNDIDAETKEITFNRAYVMHCPSKRFDPTDRITPAYVAGEEPGRLRFDFAAKAMLWLSRKQTHENV